MANERRSPSELQGTRVVDREGSRCGTIADVIVDQGTAKPLWLFVEMGKLVKHQTAIPASRTYRSADGDVVIDAEKDVVAHAPRIKRAALDPDTERALTSYYG
jgi:uncharacterized protein YrrD